MQDDNPPIDSPVTLEDLDSAPEEIPPSGTDFPVSSDQFAKKLARVGLEHDDLKAQVEAETSRILNQLIAPSAKRDFNFMWAYCGAVFLLLLLHGFSLWEFKLPESSIDFLVGSTAVTVIGLVGMVLTGIFLGARK